MEAWKDSGHYIVVRDGVMRGYKIKTGNGYVSKRPFQLVCDLEISQGDVRENDHDKTEVINAKDEHEQQVESTERNIKRGKKHSKGKESGCRPFGQTYC